MLSTANVFTLFKIAMLTAANVLTLFKIVSSEQLSLEIVAAF